MISKSPAQKSAYDFVEAWINEHITAGGYAPDGDETEANRQARACWAEARALGISAASIEADIGDLPTFIAEAIESANDDALDTPIFSATGFLVREGNLGD